MCVCSHLVCHLGGNKRREAHTNAVHLQALGEVLCVLLASAGLLAFRLDDRHGRAGAGSGLSRHAARLGLIVGARLRRRLGLASLRSDGRLGVKRDEI